MSLRTSLGTVGRGVIDDDDLLLDAVQRNGFDLLDHGGDGMCFVVRGNNDRNFHEVRIS